MTDDISPEDLAALQRLRLARRRHRKMEREFIKAKRRYDKARNKLFERFDDCEARGLDPHDPRSLD